MPTTGRTGMNRTKLNQIRRNIIAGIPMTKDYLVRFTKMKPELIKPCITSFEWGKGFKFAGEGPEQVDPNVEQMAIQMAAEKLSDKMVEDTISREVQKKVAEAMAALNDRDAAADVKKVVAKHVAK